ncbi:MAG: hypothetical protein DHS20C21_08340 [Gemmatimonadota bacterium]|nr:MAG: hypothetical protein DHS20C21_08340 [Gemmatimonadota bacterium]
MKAFKVGFVLAILALSLSAGGADAQGLQLPLISVTPTSVSFGNVPVYAVATESIVVTNDSADSPLVVSAVKTKAPFSEAVTSFTLQPGESRRIDIAFAPTATVSYNGTCTIQSNANNAPVLHVPLSGTGI